VERWKVEESDYIPLSVTPPTILK